MMINMDELRLAGFAQVVALMRNRVEHLDDQELNSLADQTARLASEIFHEISVRRGQSTKR